MKPSTIVAPTTAASSLQGLGPSALGENQIGPTQAQASIDGKLPTVYLERKVDPSVGSVSIGGQLPVVSVPGEGTSVGPGSGSVTVEGLSPTLISDRAIDPDIGFVTVEGLAPTIGTGIRGYAVTAKRRRGYTPSYEESLSATVSVPSIALVPEPIAYFDPPADRLAGMDSSLERIEKGLVEIDAREATRRRRRREEEMILKFLSRVA